MIRELTEETFDKTLEGINAEFYILFLYASWSKPAMRLKIDLETDDTIEWPIYAIDIEAYPTKAYDLDVRAIPQLNKYNSNHKLIKWQVGYDPEETIQSIIDAE